MTQTTPKIIDDDQGGITASMKGQEIRGWSYGNRDEQRAKMLMAREFVEGWYQRGLCRDGAEWQPIETAPKDGSEILLCCVDEECGLGAIFLCQWQAEDDAPNWWIHIARDLWDDAEDLWLSTEWSPTHWVPLPSPPQRQNGKHPDRDCRESAE